MPKIPKRTKNVFFVGAKKMLTNTNFIGVRGNYAFVMV